ncbi:MAG: UDP-N-acetylmuramoyl-L-alanine--D-glutamate ligase [Pseudomonadota bacterium]
MIPTPAFKDKTIAVLGLGRSGMATARALGASGAKVQAWDDALATRDMARAEGVTLADPLAGGWQGAEALVLSPGIPATYPKPHPAVAAARAAGLPIFGDVEVFARSREALGPHAVAAITGTNGKSTTTALLGHLLGMAGKPVAIGGNIGTPVLALDPLAPGGVYVLELSSYQIEQTISLAAEVAILLNITPDHLDRHGSFKDYAAVKAHLFAMQRPEQVAIIALDDEPCRRLADQLGRRVVPVSAARAVAGGVAVVDGALIDDLTGAARVLSHQTDWPGLAGQHNAQNVAAAAAAARLLGVDGAAIDAGLKTYQALAHRTEPVAEARGIRFINDSKATNPEAAAKAVAAFARVRWIAGGVAKGEGIGALDAVLGHVEKAYLIGAAEAQFAAALAGRVPLARCGTLEAAVRAAIADCGAQGGVILLSPACASFDQFRDYADRGARFTTLAKAWAEKGAL